MQGKNHLTRENIESLLSSRTTPFELNEILGAYEMAEKAYEDLKFFDGTPYFHHITRTANILISELEISDSDVICAGLLQNIHEHSSEITPEIVEYNFGPYVSLLTENLSSNKDTLDIEPSELEFDIQDKLNVPGDDYLIIKLSAILDILRFLEPCPNFDLIKLLRTTRNKYFEIMENSANPSLLYLLRAIRKERNNIIG